MIRQCAIASRSVYGAGDRRVAVTVVSKRVAVVAFRGVDSLEALVRVATGSSSRRRVRLAFAGGQPPVSVVGHVFDAFFAEEPALTAQLAERADLEEIVFCGHSMGGGLAALAALHYARGHQLPAPAILSHYSFGAPSVGDAEFYRQVGGAVARHAHYATDLDAVPHINLHDCRVRGDPHRPITSLRTPPEFATIPHAAASYVEALTPP